MQSITHCPACQTQFVVTELQLQQHNGTVRCGHCLHVFNATEQLVKVVNADGAAEVDDARLDHSELEMAAIETTGLENNDPENTSPENNISENNVIQLKSRIKPDLAPADLLIPSEVISQTATDNHLLDAPEAVTEMPEVTSNATIDATMAATSDVMPQDTPLDTSFNLAASTNLATSTNLAVSSSITHTAETHQYDYLTEPSKPKPSRKIPAALLWIFLITLIFSAIAQSVYFLRHQIALYYPNIKPSLVLACEKIGCSIDLPKKIELIVIDDSDIQEDAEHAGLMRLSTTLINQAAFQQAYPNLELTLTDVDDKPKLRRIFKPHEYLPANTNIAKGLAAGEELKVKLAMTTQGIVVAGYRVIVTY